MTRRVLGALLMGLGLAAGEAAQAVDGSGLALGNDENTAMQDDTINFPPIHLGFNY